MVKFCRESYRSNFNGIVPCAIQSRDALTTLTSARVFRKVSEKSTEVQKRRIKASQKASLAQTKRRHASKENRQCEDKTLPDGHLSRSQI